MDHLPELFERDLQRLYNEVQLMPESLLWETPSGITNCCGVLAQHMVGNLNHYIGHVLAGNNYQRNRDREFTVTGVPKEQLLAEIQETTKSIPQNLSALEMDDLKAGDSTAFPMDYTPYQFLLHLYSHLSYHLGQFNYLRRILTENKG